MQHGQENIYYQGSPHGIARRDSHYDIDHHMLHRGVGVRGEVEVYLLGVFTSSTRSSKECFIGVVVDADEVWRTS